MAAGKDRILRLQDRVEALESELTEAKTSLETFKVYNCSALSRIVSLQICILITLGTDHDWAFMRRSVAFVTAAH